MRFVPLIGAQGWMREPTRVERASRCRPRAAQEPWSASCAKSPSRSSRSTARTSARCSSVSAERGWSCSARRRTARPSSTGCAPASRRSSSARAASGSSPSRPTGPTRARVDRYVQALPDGHRPEEPAFARFPTWMWRNHEIWEFVEWLRVYNAEVREPARRAGFYGLDLYSLFTSIRSVLATSSGWTRRRRASRANATAA